MSKSKETKAVPETDPQLDWYKRHIETEQRRESATNKAYQVFIEHGLTYGDADHVIRKLEEKVASKKRFTVVSG